MATGGLFRAAKSWVVRVALCGPGLCVAHGLFASSAGAQPQLSWQAPAECPGVARAQHVLGELLGDAVGPGTSEAVRITIAREGQIYRAHVDLAHDATDARELTGDNCETLSSAALLIAALHLDPMAVADALEQTPADVSRPEPRRIHGLVGLRILGDVGTLPGAALVPALEAGLELGVLRLTAEAALWLPQVKLRDDRVGGKLTLLQGALRGCVDVLHVARTGTGPCMAVAAGPYFGTGEGPNTNEHTVAPWLAGLLGLHAHHQAGSVDLQASLEGGLTMLGPTFSIGGEPFFRPRWFARASVTCGWRL